MHRQYSAHYVPNDRLCRSEMFSRVHLRSLATGKIHPDAPKTGMLVHQLRPERYSYTIQTSEDFLGLLIQGPEEVACELLIWNWKSGALRIVSGSALMLAQCD